MLRPELRIESLSPSDWELTRELRLAAVLDSPDAFGGSYAETAARTEQEWRAWPAGGRVFAAFLDGVPVGMVCGAPSDQRPGVDYLISMWVSPTARGNNIGAALTGAVTDWARSRGGTELWLEVYETNEAACRAYLKAGFTVKGPSPHHEGAIEMVLPL